MEKSSNALQKDAKQYLDAIRATSGSSSRIAATVDLFFGSESGEQAMAANAYKRAVEEMEGNITRSIVRPSPCTPHAPRLLLPHRTLRIVLPSSNRSVNSAPTGPKSTTQSRNETKRSLPHSAHPRMSTHAMHLHSYSITTQQDPKRESYLTNLLTIPRNCPESAPISPSQHFHYTDRDDCVKAEQESETAREIFEVIDHTLRGDIPVLLEMRIPYLDPSLECMVSSSSLTRTALVAHPSFLRSQVRMQTHFASDGYEKLGGVQRYFPEGVRDDYAAGRLDQQVRNLDSLPLSPLSMSNRLSNACTRCSS